jgi:predicted membrane-bound dolichyl-phosphate-mannose-protein mannosyltransferase
VGVHSSINAAVAAGLLIHITTATCIGIIAGLFLYKTNILNISKPSNGLRYGILVGAIVYIIFAIPVAQYFLDDEFEHTTTTFNYERTIASSSTLRRRRRGRGRIKTYFRICLSGSS